MNFVAIKMLMGDKIKYLSLVAGLAFAALLVTQQGSIFTGYALQTGAWIRDTRAGDLWVMDEQVEFTEDIKPMQDTALNRVRGVDGVEWAVPMYKGFLKGILPDGSRLNIRTVGLDDATLMGAPPQMVQGKLEDLRQDKGILVNEEDLSGNLLMKRGPGPHKQLKLGDRISLNEHDAVIVGTYKASKEFFWEPVVYTTFSRAQFMAPAERRQLMYILAKTKPGVDKTKVAELISETTHLSAMTNEQFEARSMQWILDRTGIKANFGITIALGFVIGILAAGQTLYQFMLENLKHFAAIKAMGAANLTIVRMVLMQVLVVGLVGYGIGLGVAAATGIIFRKSGLAFQMVWQIPVIGLGAILLCCGFAATLSLIRVLRMEPAIVFKG